MNNTRKAVAANGDDVTLSRFVKITEPAERRKQAWLKGTRFPASIEGRTLFPKSRKPVSPRMLVSGHNNVKIGRDVRKGRLFRGYWIYTLSFEERATCPRHCHHWDTCYGNNMPFAKRVDHTDPEALEAALRENVAALLRVRGRRGVLVRLHALGDFLSVEYVQLWNELLAEHHRLAVFGYTAWRPGDPIGDKIAAVKETWGRRFSIRWSAGTGRDAAVPFVSKVPKGVIACPEQTGATRCCATCGLCWNFDKPIGFAEH